MISSEFHARGVRGASSLSIGALCLALGACAGTLQEQRSAPGTLDLSQALPAPTPSPFGTGSHAGIARSTPMSSEADLDAFLLPHAKAPRVEKPSDAVRPAREPFARKASKPRQSVEDHAEPAALTPQPEPVVLASVTPAPVAADAERYAAREQRSQQAERYRGGDTIVISVSTLIVVLLIVLIVVLLT